jgi:Sigma-70, region 4
MVAVAKPEDKGGRKSKTLNPASVTKFELYALRRLAELPRHWRPAWRGQCRLGPKGKQGAGGKVCPYVSCKHHLYLDVDPRTGSIKLNFPDLEVWEMEHCCVLDVADDGGWTLEHVGDAMNLTRERARQLELRCLEKLREEEEELSQFIK